MIINHNLPAINSHRNMSINTFEANQNLESLSSGLRINRAGDDAAGLAVSEKMRAQVRGLQQASRNAQDTISFIQTAEGWLGETTANVQRIRELSIQAANGIYTQEDRNYIQVEVKNLVDEIQRISEHAEFNQKAPLAGSYSSSAMGANGEEGGLVAHIGANMDQRIRIYIGDMSAKALEMAGDNQEMLISVSTVEQANRAIGVADNALQKINAQRADLGAYQNRLEKSIQGIDNAAENLQAAESRIRDTDMALEMIDFVKNSILTQSSTSMIAQANLRPQLVLRVLG